MKTKNMKKIIACLIMLTSLTLLTSVSWATHEVVNIYPPDGFSVGAQAQQWAWSAEKCGILTPEECTFDVNWDEPASLGNDVIIEYKYLWSNDLNPITDSNLYTNTVGSTVGERVASLTFQEIASDDFSDLRYLHIQTVYLANGNELTQSSDFVSQTFNIDNVCTGTFRLVDSVGNNLGSTQDTTVNLEIIYPEDIDRDPPATGDIIGIWVDENDGFILDPATQLDTYTLTTGAQPGVYTIWVRLEDEVGNQALYSDSFTLLDPVSISPYETGIDLAGQDTKIFTVTGDPGTYDWTIENETPDDGSGTVVQFSGANTAVNSVTVQGLEKGTFTLKATANSDGSVLTSGTITVTGSATNLDVDGNGQVLFNTDGFLIFRYLANFPTYYGDSWITGVVAGDAIRTTAADLSTYIQQGATNLVFDVDGNGEVLFNTDGFLIFRYLANFPTYYGDSWITGVVAGDATRSTAADIEAYLSTILP